MSRMYFYEQAGQQAGPLPGNQLVAQGVKEATLVWWAEATDWVAAGMVPELQVFFTPFHPATISPSPAPAANLVKPLRPVVPTSTPARSLFTGRNLKIGVVVLLALGAEVASRAKPDVTEPERTERQATAPEPEEEIKEIGYAANHLHNEDASTSGEEPSVEFSAASEPAQADAIESIDNNNGWLNVHYEVGTPRSFGVGKDPFFAYSPHLIVTHNERVSCQVRDIYGNRLTDGTTLNGSSACTGLRVVGDHIIIDVDTGHSTHQETYDANLRLLRTSPSHMY